MRICSQNKLTLSTKEKSKFEMLTPENEQYHEMDRNDRSGQQIIEKSRATTESIATTGVVNEIRKKNTNFNH